MKNVWLILLGSTFLTGCAAHRISTTNEAAWVSTDPQPEITQLNTWPEGNQCFEPMLYVLSLGIIPTHCVNRFEVKSSSNPEQQANVSVTTIGGWAALFLAPLPNWKFGEAPEKYRFKYSGPVESTKHDQ